LNYVKEVSLAKLHAIIRLSTTAQRPWFYISYPNYKSFLYYLDVTTCRLLILFIKARVSRIPLSGVS